MSGQIAVIARSQPTPEGHTRLYVGRPNVLGNPFPLRSEADREGVIQRYRIWLAEQMRAQNSPARAQIERLREAVGKGQSFALECYCAPRACHADVIAEYLLGMRASEEQKRLDCLWHAAQRLMLGSYEHLNAANPGGIEELERALAGWIRPRAALARE